VSFVLDGWTSGNQYPFQGIKARWINREWELKEEILDLDILHGRHDGGNLAESFIRVLEEFSLIPKLLGLTTDNASNCDTMFDHLRSILAQRVTQYDFAILYALKPI